MKYVKPSVRFKVTELEDHARLRSERVTSLLVVQTNNAFTLLVELRSASRILRGRHQPRDPDMLTDFRIVFVAGAIDERNAVKLFLVGAFIVGDIQFLEDGSDIDLSYVTHDTRLLRIDPGF